MNLNSRPSVVVTGGFNDIGYELTKRLLRAEPSSAQS